MECKSVKISEYSLNKIRKIGEEVGKPSDDTAVRYILDDREKLKIENELLRKKLDENNKKIDVTIEIYKHQKVAVVKINEKEISRLSFDKYEHDNYSMVFYIDNKDVINIDYTTVIEI